MDIKSIKFKHERFNLIQAVHGGLQEDASFEAVAVIEKKTDEIFEELEELAKETPNMGDSHLIEVCVKKATTPEELVLFLHAVCSADRCPSHPFIEMVKRGFRT